MRVRCEPGRRAFEARAADAISWSMIAKSGYRFSQKPALGLDPGIMLHI
jgi:hypothetical protein